MKKILYSATVVKTHIMQFHVPYLKMLKDMGWHTEVAAKNDYEDPSDCVIPGCDRYVDIPFERQPWNPRNIKAYRELKTLIREENFDLIHCHTPVGAMITRLAAAGARKQGTKVLYTAHGFHFFKGAPLLNWLLYYPAEWLLAPLTDVLITINGEDYRFAQKHLKAKKVVYIPGVGVDREKFHRDPVFGQKKRRDLGFGEEDFLLLTVAEMTKNKNHATVLKALALLKDRPGFEHFHYLIVGRGTQWPALEQQAKDLGIEGQVHFLGYRSDAAEIYRAADLFAFMSFREGLSLALMEAMSSGLPALCAEIRGNTDLIRDGVSGFFAENTAEAVADAIWKLYENPALRQKAGMAAAEATEKFDSLLVKKAMKDLYESL